ncbi:MAG: T9SS type A sorting domain-containing protein [Bacteroidales bacterium]
MHATDAIFRNNTRSVHALLYDNKPDSANDGRILSYNGYFNNCTFELNNDYIGTEIFHKHVDLSNVKGIKFTGCDFINTCTDYDKISYWNTAIAMYNASSIIKGKTVVYDPTNCTDSTNFSGFYSGINSVNDLSLPATLTVKHANFTNNAFGIKMSNNSYSSILFSNFLIGRLWDCGGGIYSQSINNFKIEENHFSKFTPIPNVNFYGIIMDDSKGVNNIYRNTFNGLTYGNFAKNKNWVGNNTFEGLEYTCNTNINNSCDFYVVDNATGASGIQAFQGNENKPAGNTFSDSRIKWHFYNGGDHLIEYFYNRNINSQIPNSNLINEKVILTPTDTCNACLSHYEYVGNDDDILRGEERLAKEQEYYDAYNNYTNIKTLYDRSIDGGDTEGEIRDIETAQPEDMWQLRTQLLGHSPHLSQEVLIEASDRSDIFIESVLFEILSANPDELRKDSLINYLENKETPLPDYMIELLKQIATGSTAKTALQKQMSTYKLQYSQAAMELIRSILNDTVLNLVDLRNWLDNLGGLNSDRQIIATYIYEDDYSNALSLANMLPSLYNLSERELIEHNQYMQILTLYQTLYNSNRTIYELNNEEKAIITDFADNGIGIAQSMAKAIMIGVYNSTDYYDDCPIVTEKRGESHLKPVNPNNLSGALGLSISANPNPAVLWTAFDYKLPESKTNAIITITNMMGKIVDKIEIYDQQGQVVWDTRNVPSGIYLYTIQCDNLVLSDKIIIKK